MRVEQKPALVRRGVTQLMYVGDDDAVEKATPDYWRIAKIAGAAWIAMWILAGISPPKSSRR